MSAAKPTPRPDDDALDDDALPAAVVCATCGRGDCAGCTATRPLPPRGTSVVPWEDPAVAPGDRFGGTAAVATRGAEAFFRALPDGAVAPALRFAVLAELAAVGSTVLAYLALALALVPGMAARCVASAAFRLRVGALAAVATVAFAAALVGLHALHGLLLGRAATRAGGMAAGGRALRFGFYACGWDLCTSPAGVAGALAREGVRPTLRLLGAAMAAPRRGARGLLGALAVEGDAAARAERGAAVAAIAATVPLVLVVLAALAALAAAAFG